MLRVDAVGITGGLSRPRKMPGPAFNLPIDACGVGSRLRKMPGSVCADCYAGKGRYLTVRVKAALERRLAAIDHPQWVEGMVELINSRALKSGHFRWHDSGDIQSTMHLLKIVQICEQTPMISHWLPTREYEIVRCVATSTQFPRNLTIRLSAHMIGGEPPVWLGFPVSTVSSAGAAPPDGSYRCPQPPRGAHRCGECRACWKAEVPWVDYLRR
jgi:hypothetical protein